MQLNLIEWVVYHDAYDSDSYLTNRSVWAEGFDTTPDPETETLLWLIQHIEKLAEPLRSLAREYLKRQVN